MSELTIKQFVINYFSNQLTGRFLEIGANDGEPDNNNEPFWGLVEKNWSGVYCEPNPIACAQLLKNVMPYGDRIKIVNGALSTDVGLKTFYVSVDSKGPSSSIHLEWMQQQTYHKPNDRQYPIITNSFTLENLLDNVGYDFDAMSIDIETNEYHLEQMLYDFNFSKLNNCKLIMLEVCSKKITQSLLNLGYSINTTLPNNSGPGINLIFTR
jgi:FkbM family methyltransferase